MMNSQKNQLDNFFTPSSFYNLQAAGISVWIICLVIGSIFTDLTSFTFRIIAISFSLVISLSLFLKNKSWRKYYNYILIIVNAALIFINASGYNSITYSYAFDNSRLNHTEAKQNGFLNLHNQILWWPDYRLLDKADSLQAQAQKLKRINEGLINQFAFIKDWVNSTITDKKSKDTLNSLLKYVGSYKVDSSDYVFLKTRNEKYITRYNKTIDSLKLELRLRPVITSSYTLNGKEISALDYIDTLLRKNRELQVQLRKYNKPPIINAVPDQTIILPNQTHEDSLKKGIQ